MPISKGSSNVNVSLQEEFEPYLGHWVCSRAFPRNSWEEESPELRLQNSMGSNSNQKEAVHVSGSVVSTAR